MGEQRILTIENASLLADIHASAFPDPWVEAEFRKFLNSPGVTGWYAGDEAFLLIRTVADEAEILTLATRPDARRQGHAKTLVRQMLDYLRGQGVTRCFLEVAESNHAAIGLYQQAGFTEISRRKGYYATSEGRQDAVVMAAIPVKAGIQGTVSMAQ